MALTLMEFQERLLEVDISELISLLEISNEDILDRFSDLVEDHLDELEEIFGQEDEEDV